jgi:ribonucleoside-diphosphate reductase alpha chain
LEEEGRREEWPETVKRYINFYKKHYNYNPRIPWDDLEDAILKLHTMPSMRALMTAGEAAERSHVATYNCSFVAAEEKEVFKQILYILMCGTGVGFSVERQYVNKLPTVPLNFVQHTGKILVDDSKEGWAHAFGAMVENLFNGVHSELDVSKLRGAGERLKTFGGRSSGPQPLVDLAKFTHRIFDKARGRKLTSLEVHDIICKIADVVVVGGVRRSALISLSNLSDERMRHAKTGQWWEADIQRALANNSAVYTEKPSAETFMREFLAMVESKSGERGIFNRASIPQNRLDSYDKGHGTNPCAEITLRSKQFCNLKIH